MSRPTPRLMAPTLRRISRPPGVRSFNSGYEIGTRISGRLEATDQERPAQLGVYYEDISIPERYITPEEQISSVQQIYTKRWFEGARVNWVYADARVVRCQFSYPAAGLIEPATLIAIITAIGVIIAAIAPIIWSYTAYKVVSAIPPESWEWIVKGGIIIGVAFVTAELIRAVRGR